MKFNKNSLLLSSIKDLISIMSKLKKLCKNLKLSYSVLCLLLISTALRIFAYVYIGGFAPSIAIDINMSNYMLMVNYVKSEMLSLSNTFMQDLMCYMKYFFISASAYIVIRINDRHDKIYDGLYYNKYVRLYNCLFIVFKFLLTYYALIIVSLFTVIEISEASFLAPTIKLNTIIIINWIMFFIVGVYKHIAAKLRFSKIRMKEVIEALESGRNEDGHLRYTENATYCVYSDFVARPSKKEVLQRKIKYKKYYLIEDSNNKKQLHYIIVRKTVYNTKKKDSFKIIRKSDNLTEIKYYFLEDKMKKCN